MASLSFMYPSCHGKNMEYDCLRDTVHICHHCADYHHDVCHGWGHCLPCLLVFLLTPLWLCFNEILSLFLLTMFRKESLEKLCNVSKQRKSKKLFMFCVQCTLRIMAVQTFFAVTDSAIDCWWMPVCVSHCTLCAHL